MVHAPTSEPATSTAASASATSSAEEAASGLPLVAGRHVLVDPGAGAAPLTIRALLGPQPAPVGGHSERPLTQRLRRQRGQRHEPVRPGDGGHDEAVEVVE